MKIPKDGNEFRSLSLPTIKDKIVQQAVKDLLAPLIEAEFLDVSYAYRENKGPLKAINRVHHLLANEKREWVTICDIDSYFDTINHDLLFSMLTEKIKDEKLLTLLRLWVRMGRVDKKMKWQDVVKGIPQGSILSPLLSNFYLHRFDSLMVERRFGYIRYADDFVILSSSEGEAYRALKETKAFLEKELKLSLNAGSVVKKTSEGFEYLGILFKGLEKTVTAEKLDKLKNSIKTAARLDKDGNMTELFQTIEGIGRYYGALLSQELIGQLDEHTIACLKTTLNAAYNEGMFAGKIELEAVLLPVQFMSQKYRLYKNRAVKEIVSYCRRKRKEKAPETGGKQAKDPVKRRKREYQRLEADGFELLITTPGVFIGKTKKGISIRERGIKKHEAPFLNLKNISISAGGVAISSNVIHYCAEKGIPIDFLGFDGKPYAKIYSPQAVSASVGLAQLQSLENGKAQALARTFVSGKIRNQINLAKYWHKYRKGKDEDYTAAFGGKTSQMEALAKEAKALKEQDMELLRGKLFSIEGRAAACYWELVEKLLNDDIEFEGRVRKGATDLVNSLLNYGYGILYSRMWEAVFSAGLNPNISYLHKPQDNKPTLAFDLIEEFRQQAVDRAVFSLITKGEDLKMEKDLLSPDTRKRVTERVLERIHTVEEFRGRELRLSQIMKEQAKALAGFLEGKTKSYKPYLGKW